MNKLFKGREAKQKAYTQKKLERNLNISLQKKNQQTIKGESNTRNKGQKCCKAYRKLIAK